MTTSLPASIIVMIALYGLLFAVVGVCARLNRLAGRPRFNGWLIGAGLVGVIGGYSAWAFSAGSDPSRSERFGGVEAFTIAMVTLLIVWPALWRGIAWRKRAAQA